AATLMRRKQKHIGPVRPCRKFSTMLELRHRNPKNRMRSLSIDDKKISRDRATAQADRSVHPADFAISNAMPATGRVAHHSDAVLQMQPCARSTADCEQV